VLYALLYRRPPWLASETASVVEQLRDSAIDFRLPTPTVALTEISRRCLAIDPKERYADAGEIAEALSTYITELKR
jgi:hypothetical protein